MIDLARQPRKRPLAQLPLEPPVPHTDPQADDPAAMLLDVRLPHDDDLPRHMAGFTFFWLRYVRAFRPQYHCAGCLVGPYEEAVSATMPLPIRVVLRQWEPFAYLCGVADTGQWASNFHLPMIYAPGERIEAQTYHGVRITVHHAREVAIPWVEDGWQGFPLSYTTCRNWQFGLAHFGYNGARPFSDELSNAEFRTEEVATFAHMRQRGKLTREEVRARLRSADEDAGPDFDLGYTVECRREFEEPPEW
ncbi:MAG: hypothetical protein WCG26_05440 [Chloroflexales bacterium]